jgi:hypothetical protein
MGAGAIVGGTDDTAEAKQIMREWIHVLLEIGKKVKKVLG